MPSRRPTGSTSTPSPRRVWLIVAACILLLAGLAAAWRYTPLADLITPVQIRAWAKAARETGWGPFALILAYTPAAFLMFPRQLLTLFAVIAFGPWLGFSYAICGVMLCAIAAYYAGFAVPPKTLDRLARGKLSSAKKILRKHSVPAVLALRVLPTAPFVVESMACGALRIGFAGYIVGTLLGMAPGVLATTVFGNEVAAALEEAGEMNWWIAGGAIVLFIATMLLLRRVLKD